MQFASAGGIWGAMARSTSNPVPTATMINMPMSSSAIQT
jgi:hypothetical protein